MRATVLDSNGEERDGCGPQSRLRVRLSPGLHYSPSPGVSLLLLEAIFRTGAWSFWLVSYCCCSRLPQTQWLKTAWIYYDAVKKSKICLMRLKSRWCPNCVPSPGSRGKFFPCLFQLFTFLGLWQHHPTSASIIPSPSLTLVLFLPSDKDHWGYTGPTQTVRRISPSQDP